MASKKRSNCKLKTEADSEIPELGLDSGRFNIDCELNPARVVGAAARAARNYGKYRRDRKRNRPSASKRKRTRISIDSQYESSRKHNDDSHHHGSHKDSDEDDDD